MRGSRVTEEVAAYRETAVIPLRAVTVVVQDAPGSEHPLRVVRVST